jgi:hypothetical protein
MMKLHGLLQNFQMVMLKHRSHLNLLIPVIFPVYKLYDKLSKYLISLSYCMDQHQHLELCWTWLQIGIS